MLKNLTFAALLLAISLPATAQNWSFGAATGPFVFGDFVERKLRLTNGEDNEPVTMTLSAATRAGLALDLERSLGDRWAVRVEGTFTRAPFTAKQSGGPGDGTEISEGKLSVSTFMLPVVFRINPHGAFRVHLMAGPAVAIYRADAPKSAGASPAFEGTQGEWGGAFGGGIGWWVSDRFAIEGNLTDIVTTSPFDRDSFPDVPGITIRNPHNVHTTVGLRWKF